jgi:hypothetical protein
VEVKVVDKETVEDKVVALGNEMDRVLAGVRDLVEDEVKITEEHLVMGVLVFVQNVVKRSRINKV